MTKDYFSDFELFGYKRKFDKQFLLNLNKTRGEFGSTFNVSPLKGAVVRWDRTKSRHNINYWGSFQAVDLFPKSRTGNCGIKTANEAIDLVELCLKNNINGIGVYPHFTYRGVKWWGFHLDNRGKRGECIWIDTARYPKHHYEYQNYTTEK